MYNLTNISTIKNIMSKYNFSFSKSLGQNFLTNPSVCPKIAQLGNANKDFGIIEIGTGFGVLTKELAKRAKKVVAIEIDSKLIPVLSETLSEFDNIVIKNEDILKIDLFKLIENEFNGMPVAICANLPYYITSPIIAKLLEDKLPIESITVMVQKEAGNRFCANMGTRECGAITACIAYYSQPKILFNVSRTSFLPIPNVDSCVIKLDIKKNVNKNVLDEKHLFNVIKLAFSQRRKTLKNPLSSGLNISKEQIIIALEKSNINPKARAEELTLSDFISLSNTLLEFK